MSGARLYRIILPVTDLELAARFYGAMLEMPGTRVSGGRHYFDCGGTILACFFPEGDGDAQALPPLPDHIYFAVEDLPGALSRVASAGGRLAEGEIHGAPAGAIHKRPWGEDSFYALDPFGNQICFVKQGTEFTG